MGTAAHSAARAQLTSPVGVSARGILFNLVGLAQPCLLLTAFPEGLRRDRTVPGTGRFLRSVNKWRSRNGCLQRGACDRITRLPVTAPTARALGRNRYGRKNPHSQRRKPLSKLGVAGMHRRTVAYHQTRKQRCGFHAI